MAKMELKDDELDGVSGGVQAMQKFLGESAEAQMLHAQETTASAKSSLSSATTTSDYKSTMTDLTAMAASMRASAEAAKLGSTSLHDTDSKLVAKTDTAVLTMDQKTSLLQTDDQKMKDLKDVTTQINSFIKEMAGTSAEKLESLKKV